jgi:hypothetical protein
MGGSYFCLFSYASLVQSMDEMMQVGEVKQYEEDISIRDQHKELSTVDSSSLA